MVLVVAGLVVVAIVAAVGISVVIARSGTRPLSWPKLPDPSAARSGSVSAGTTVGQGGGKGPGVLRVDVPASATSLTIDISCQGTGTVHTSTLATVSCFKDQPVIYSVTAELAGPISDITVQAPTGTVWRLYVTAS